MRSEIIRLAWTEFSMFFKENQQYNKRLRSCVSDSAMATYLQNNSRLQKPPDMYRKGDQQTPYHFLQQQQMDGISRPQFWNEESKGRMLK